MKILITGGLGFIGSHTATNLLQIGYEVIILDNMSNSCEEPLKRIKQITGIKPIFIKGNILDRKLVNNIFVKYSISVVLHFAGLKSVNESIKKPLEYYENNVQGTQTLVQTMEKAGVFNFVFSSSATVYGEFEEMPVSELSKIVSPQNPYGKSKLMVEEMLKDLSIASSKWRIGILRYFNPIGAHDSKLIGDAPLNRPQNLLPYITQVAVGNLEKLKIYGNDYKTCDGTGVRDYIHIMDLSYGHIKVIKFLENNTGINIWNLGTGKGYSVLQILNTFEIVTGIKIPYEIVDKRKGDVGTCYADPTKAKKELGWKASRELPQMLLDAWNWQKENPNGYKANQI